MRGDGLGDREGCLLIEEKWILVRNISHLFPVLSCRPPRDLDSKACISIGEEVRLGVMGRRPLGRGDHHRLAAVMLTACPGGLLVGLLNFSPPKKRQISEHQLLKKNVAHFPWNGRQLLDE